MTPVGSRKSVGLSIDLANRTAVVDPSGALFLEHDRALLVSDLHLEKASAFATRRVLLPPYDTVATLIRFPNVVAYYAPRVIIALGDSFHDKGGSRRLSLNDRTRLEALQTGREWIWVLGNHDRSAPVDLAGAAVESLTIGQLTLRHEPVSGAECEIAGHLHPVARLAARGRSLRRRCFVADGSRCIMPAFGAYAGGLNIHSTPFKPLFGAAGFTAYVLGQEQIFSASRHRCLAD
jgi:DNA ligase-associated metallophosphoesterase